MQDPANAHLETDQPLNAGAGPDAHGGHDGHGAEEAEALGPIDPLAWGAGILGVILGLVVAACFVVATSGLGAF
ncbi:MAG: hypothetical protein C4343_02980 [Chloroflexota bacterium]